MRPASPPGIGMEIAVVNFTVDAVIAPTIIRPSIPAHFVNIFKVPF